LAQHCFPGAQQMPCAERGTTHPFSPFLQHSSRLREAQNSSLLQHAVPHLRSSGHETQWGPLRDPHRSVSLQIHASPPPRQHFSPV
jgi:hypothetical protein